jgi:hypothetical protein
MLGMKWRRLRMTEEWMKRRRDGFLGERCETLWNAAGRLTFSTYNGRNTKREWILWWNGGVNGWWNDDRIKLMAMVCWNSTMDSVRSNEKEQGSIISPPALMPTGETSKDNICQGEVQVQRHHPNQSQVRPLHLSPIDKVF